MHAVPRENSPLSTIILFPVSTILPAPYACEIYLLDHILGLLQKPNCRSHPPRVMKCWSLNGAPVYSDLYLAYSCETCPIVLLIFRLERTWCGLYRWNGCCIWYYRYRCLRNSYTTSLFSQTLKVPVKRVFQVSFSFLLLC